MADPPQGSVTEPTRLAERPGDTDSCIDLTLCSRDLPSRLTWTLGSHVDSDHLLCEVHCRVCQSSFKVQTST